MAKLTPKQQLEKKQASLERKEKKLDKEHEDAEAKLERKEKRLKKQKEELKAKEEKQKQEIDLKSLERKLATQEDKLDFTKTFDNTIIGALTFVAGLFWRDVITELLELFPALPGWFGTFFSAILITTIFVVLIVRMNKRTKKADDSLDKLRKKVDDAKVKKAMQEE